MDHGSPFGQTCSCGRTLLNPTLLKNHQYVCKSSKKHLSNVLAKAKEALTARKRKAPSLLENSDEESQHAPVSSSAVEHGQGTEVSHNHVIASLYKHVLHRFQRSLAQLLSRRQSIPERFHLAIKGWVWSCMMGISQISSRNQL